MDPVGVKDGWFVDAAIGRGKRLEVSPGVFRSAGGPTGVGSGYDGFPDLPEPGDTIPPAGSTDSSPITGMTRSEMRAVFRRAVGFDGSAMMYDLPTHADTDDFLMSVWLNFSESVRDSNPLVVPNQFQGALYHTNDNVAGTGNVGSVGIEISPGVMVDAQPAVNPEFEGLYATDRQTYISGLTDYQFPTAGGAADVGWVHLMISKRKVGSTIHTQIYINDTEIFIETNDIGPSLQFSIADTSFMGNDYLNNIGGRAVASCLFIEDPYQNEQRFWSAPDLADGVACAMAELWIAPGHYLDLSLAANREKFHITSLAGDTYNPCDLGATGGRPTGSSPLIYCRGKASQFPINQVSGFTPQGLPNETFSVYGTLQDVDDPPG